MVMGKQSGQCGQGKAWPGFLSMARAPRQPAGHRLRGVGWEVWQAQAKRARIPARGVSLHQWGEGEREMGNRSSASPFHHTLG